MWWILKTPVKQDLFKESFGSEYISLLYVKYLIIYICNEF